MTIPVVILTFKNSIETVATFVILSIQCLGWHASKSFECVLNKIKG